VQNSIKSSVLGLPPMGGSSNKNGKKRAERVINTNVPSHDGTVLVEDYEDNEDNN